MKILFCNYEYPPLGGGGGVINALLAEDLAKVHQVTVLTSSSFGLADEESVNGVRVIRTPVYFRKQQASANFPSMAAYMINGIRKGKELLTREKFDVINTHFALPSGPVGHALSKYSGLPNVLSVHGGDLYDPSKFTSPHRHVILRLWVRHLLRKADRLVGQSLNTVENVAKYYDSSLAVGLIPLGINRPQFESAQRSELGLEEDDFVMVTVGRLVSRKRLERLLAVMQQLNMSNLKLVVIGSGPKLEALSQLANQLGLGDKVVFEGFIPEQRKLALLKAADVYVSTSEHEGFGLVFLEAMAAGLPVVCYNHGGQTDFLENGKTGALLELNDESSFRQAVESLYGDTELRRTMGAYNVQRVEKYYIENCAREYEKLFEETLRSGAGN